MPYIGNVPAESYSQVSYQDLTGGSGTSFTLDYPVGSAGEIEVFVNNVRQEPTVAYTVSGTSLTMTGSIAATDDFYVVFQGKAQQTIGIPEKQSDGTYVFPDDVTVNGNITSTGIDDNATSTAMTLDSSGNLLVGTTDNTVYNNSGSGTGINLQNFGNIAVARDGNDCMVLNRLNSDGPIALFNKDGTSVGSIGTNSSRTYIGSGSGQSGLKFNTGAIVPVSGADGVNNDAAYNLGASTARFTNLYLSGGVYLGGTGSANHLDDYEEGSWTPTIVGNNGASGQSYTYQNGVYLKVGRFVHLTFDVALSAKGTLSGTYVVLGGLPFSPTGSNLGGSMLATYVSGWNALGSQHIVAYINASLVFLMNGTTDYITIGDNNVTNSSRLIGSMWLYAS
jgi:hypothetical protein